MFFSLFPSRSQFSSSSSLSLPFLSHSQIKFWSEDLFKLQLQKKILKNFQKKKPKTKKRTKNGVFLSLKLKEIQNPVIRKNRSEKSKKNSKKRKKVFLALFQIVFLALFLIQPFFKWQWQLFNSQPNRTNQIQYTTIFLSVAKNCSSLFERARECVRCSRPQEENIFFFVFRKIRKINVKALQRFFFIYLVVNLKASFGETMDSTFTRYFEKIFLFFWWAVCWLIYILTLGGLLAIQHDVNSFYFLLDLFFKISISPLPESLQEILSLREGAGTTKCTTPQIESQKKGTESPPFKLPGRMIDLGTNGIVEEPEQGHKMSSPKDSEEEDEDKDKDKDPDFKETSDYKEEKEGKKEKRKRSGKEEENSQKRRRVD